jgi:hypothetical protein
MATVSYLLAPDAERRPWHCRQALGADVLFTLDTHAEGTLFDEAQCSADVPQQIGIAVQIAYRQITLGGLLYFIESIWALFDGDAIALRISRTSSTCLTSSTLLYLSNSLFVICAFSCLLRQWA